MADLCPGLPGRHRLRDPHAAADGQHDGLSEQWRRLGHQRVTLLVDNGHVMSSMTGSFAPGKPIIDLIIGRVSLA
ncbi:short-chain type dehydrogenase/reductase domain protein [Mycobacterium xenopi 3993]|nr:short-chain type dehydrogenase/reductase domain protein [Mycobacterium xenopi 3993]